MMLTDEDNDDDHDDDDDNDDVMGVTRGKLRASTLRLLQRF